MPVYIITGVSRGIGFELLKQLSADKDNLVVGLVRDKAATDTKVETELGERANVHILTADITKHASLKQAAAQTADIVGHVGVDYLIANAALVSMLDAYCPIGALADKVEELEQVTHDLIQTNVVGQMHLFNLFLPLILKAETRKVVAITSGLADLDLTNKHDIDVAALYAMSKAALNVVVAKYSAQYKKDGVLFMGISPGVVEVGRNANATPEEISGMMGLVGKLVEYAPDFKGPITPEESVKHVRAVWEKASIESGSAGAFVSHYGDQQWI